MRLLYFEDDAIDQRLFKRACKNLPGLEITYYDSCMGLKEDYINSYDGIIIDQYLKDCSAMQFRDKNITIPMAVLSASEKLNGSEEGFIGIWQKPIKENVLKMILEKMDFPNLEREVISMEYIDELTEGNLDERKDLLKSIYKSIEQNNDALKTFDLLESKEIQQYLHKQKSKVGIFYLEKLHAKIDSAEDKFKNGEDKNEIKQEVVDIVKAVSAFLIELKSNI